MSAPCRFCGTGLQHVFCDLGMSPLSNAFLAADMLNQMEPFYPLRAYVCAQCFLVQLEEFESPEQIFSEYAYFSSYSDSWLAHARSYTQVMRDRLQLNGDSRVIEIASNDGYLLQYFATEGIPVLGVEPAANVAVAAEEKGIPTRVEFFGRETARRMLKEGETADLLLGNNVLAHVPDINDFVTGMKIVLKPDGLVTMEFPHLLQLIGKNQFDTIYHEHFSYLSLLAVERVFAQHGLTLHDVDELPTHGGSIRIHAAHTEAGRAASDALQRLRDSENAAGLADLATYLNFAQRAPSAKRELLEFLIGAKAAGKRVAAYGAPAKGNTLLNYCGIREDFIDYTVDRSPAKQGRFLPGTHIPVFSPDKIRETRPDYVLILPWNLREEIVATMAHIREWGGQFVVPIPRVEVLS